MTDAASGPPNSAAMAAKAPASTSSCASVCSSAHEPNGDRSHPQAERDERRLRPEHEPEAEGRQAGEQDARAARWGDLAPSADPLERRMAAVAREAQEQRDEHASERRHEDHVPPGRLAPVQPVRNDLPDEVDDVVDRGLEEHRRDGDGEAEESR